MSELTISQIIKLIIGAFVVVAVVAGVYLIFKNNLLGFFNGLPTNSTKLWLVLA